MTADLRSYCLRFAAASDEVLQALVAPAPRRATRRPEVSRTPEVEAWLSRLGGDLRHLGAIGGDTADDD